MKYLLLLSLCFTLFSTQLDGQEALSMRSTAYGFSLGGQLGITGWSCEDLDVAGELGPAVGLRLSYGFSELFEAFFEYDVGVIFPAWEQIEPFPFSHADLGLRMNYGGTLKSVRLFLDLAFTYQYSIQDAVDTYSNEFVLLDMGGYGFTLGGGLKYHLTLPFALVLGGKFTFATFSEVEVDGISYDEEWVANSYRFSVGAAYYFQ